MFIDKYETDRVSKYLEFFDEIIAELDSIPRTNLYLSELESTFLEEKKNFKQTFYLKLQSFRSHFKSIDGKTIDATSIRPSLAKVFVDFSESDKLYKSYSLNDIGKTIGQRIDKIEKELDENPSSLGSELTDWFNEILILIFIYGIKFFEISDEYHTWEKEIDTCFSQAYELENIYNLCINYKDIGCRLWVVRYFKRCNSRLVVLDDIEFEEANYLDLDSDEKEELRNQKTKPGPDTPTELLNDIEKLIKKLPKAYFHKNGKIKHTSAAKYALDPNEATWFAEKWDYGVKHIGNLIKKEFKKVNSSWNN